MPNSKDLICSDVVPNSNAIFNNKYVKYFSLKIEERFCTHVVLLIIFLISFVLVLV